MNIPYTDLHPSYNLLTPTPSIDLLDSPIESVARKLGCFAGRSVSYLRSKQGKRRILQTYILSEVVITVFAVISMFLAGLYWPAILLTLINAYLLYAAMDII